MPGLKARGFADIGNVLVFMALLIVVPVAAVLLLDGLAPTFFNALAGLVGNLTTLSTGSTIGDAILGIFVIIIPVVAVAFFGTLTIDAMKIAYKGRSGGGGV